MEARGRRSDIRSRRSGIKLISDLRLLTSGMDGFSNLYGFYDLKYLNDFNGLNGLPFAAYRSPLEDLANRPIDQSVIATCPQPACPEPACPEPVEGSKDALCELVSLPPREEASRVAHNLQRLLAIQISAGTTKVTKEIFLTLSSSLCSSWFP
jgi:hypothetical protein